ncbi:hypothetical protein GGR58DRAFT_495742 [Xylaria digitata]|nr:hypothetical protein GGR58DRAFT_495742 [Xylaria digitata]
MPSPPSSPPSSSSSSSPSSPPQPRQGPTNGVFRNGNWFCNCEPPRLATMRQVKKETSKHKDKKFYGCPINIGEGNRCNMFVLMEEAEQRQRESFKSNGRTEKRQTTIHESFTPRKLKREPGERVPEIETTTDLQTVDNEASTSNPALTSTLGGGGKGPYSGLGDIYGTSDTSSDEDEDEERINSPTPRITKNTTTLQSSTMAKTPTTSSKRKRSSGEEDLLDDLSASGAEELAAATDRSSKAAGTAGKRRDAFTTPSGMRMTDMDNGMPTPSDTKGKSVKKVLFAKDESTASSKRQCLGADELFGTNATIDSTASPSINPANMTSEVMDILKEERITFATRSAVRRTLQKYANQAMGYERGRDVSRKAMKELEERCAQLQAKNDSLQAENESLKTKNNNLEKGREEGRTGLMDLWDNLEKARDGAMELWNRV